MRYNAYIFVTETDCHNMSWMFCVIAGVGILHICIQNSTRARTSLRILESGRVEEVWPLVTQQRDLRIGLVLDQIVSLAFPPLLVLGFECEVGDEAATEKEHDHVGEYDGMARTEVWLKRVS